MGGHTLGWCPDLRGPGVSLCLLREMTELVSSCHPLQLQSADLVLQGLQGSDHGCQREKRRHKPCLLYIHVCNVCMYMCILHTYTYSKYRLFLLLEKNKVIHVLHNYVHVCVH